MDLKQQQKNNNNILCKHPKQSNIIFFTILLLVFKILLILFLPGCWVEENSCCERCIFVFCWFCFVLHLSSLSGRHCAEEGIVGLWRRKLQPADSPKLSRAFFEIVAIFPFWKLWYFYFRNCAISIFEIVIFKRSTSKLMLFLPTFSVLLTNTHSIRLRNPEVDNRETNQTFKTKDSRSMACIGTEVQDREEKVTNKQ